MNTTPSPDPSDGAQPKIPVQADQKEIPKTTTEAPVGPDDVIIIPDDGPTEHVNPKEVEPATKKPAAPKPTSQIDAGLAWQGGARPQAADMASMRSRITQIKSSPQIQPITSIPPVAPLPPQPLPPSPEPVAPIPSATPSQETLKKEERPLLRTVRTFKDDMAQVITRKQVSVVSAISAEENRRARKEMSDVTSGDVGERRGLLSGVGYFILGISVTLLIVGGLGVAGALYFFKEPSSVLPASEIPSYIIVEEQRSVNTDNLSKSQMLSGLIKFKNDLNTKVGSITQVYFTKTVVDPVEQRARPVLLPTMEWLEIMQVHMPAPLSRALGQRMLFGFHQFNEVHPFLILKATSYETAFASMLDWERELNADLAPLFGPIVVQRFTRPVEEEPAPPATITASSTTATTSTSSEPAVTQTPEAAAQRTTTTLFLPHAFEDAVIVNKDVRILRDSDRNIALIYGFYDKATIVITTDENTFKEVVTRLSSRRF